MKKEAVSRFLKSHCIGATDWLCSDFSTNQRRCNKSWLVLPRLQWLWSGIHCYYLHHSLQIIGVILAFFKESC